MLLVKQVVLFIEITTLSTYVTLSHGEEIVLQRHSHILRYCFRE